MRYSGNICDGCKEPLLDNEDIVVCPECATPQHRHCYDKAGECVNSHLHGTDFTWQGTVSENTSAETSTLVNQEKKGDELTCPNCQHSNPAGSEVCRNCGMKFTMFGINVVENLKQQEKENAPVQDSNEIPFYEAPFKVGDGEGFENAPLQEPESETTKTQQIDFSNDSNIFRGPYPVDDYTCGVRTNTMGSFIRNNAQVYIDKFKRSENKRSLGFNWAAFFFSPYWFFYRRLYKPGIIMLTVQLCVSIVTAPSLNKFLTFYQTFMSNLETMTEEMLNESYLQLQSLMTPALIVMGITFLMRIISGFIGNGLYKKHVLRSIDISMNLATVREKIAYFAKNGGTSMIAVLIAYLAETGLSYLAGYLMY